MAKMVKLQQGTKEWLDWRLSGITATEAACAMGVSKWGTALSVWKDKLDPKPHETSEYEEWGTLLEDVIKFRKFGKEHPEFEVRQGECYEDGWRKCSLDGELYDRDGNFVAILEIKTASSESGWDPIPKGYVAQAQWQMHVTGIRKVYFAVLVQGHHYLEREIDYDPEYCERLEIACKKLWDCICDRVPPAADPDHADIDQDAVNEIAGEATDKLESYELSEEEYALFCELKERLSEDERRFKAQKLVLTQYLTRHKYLTCHGNRVGQMVAMKPRESVDAVALRTEFPEVYEKVRKIGKPTFYPKFG